MSVTIPVLGGVLRRKATFEGVAFGGGVPIPNKLLVWAEGDILGGWLVEQDPNARQDPNVDYRFYRRDKKNNFHLYTDPHGDTITDDWDTTNATYLLWQDIMRINPAPLRAADALEGAFFFDGNGDPVPHTMAELINHAAGSHIFFFSQHKNKYVFRLYDSILSGDELAAAQAY